MNHGFKKLTEIIKTIDIFKILAFFIPLSAILAIILTILSMSEGITSIFPHTYYIPIILASYLYLKKGFYFDANTLFAWIQAYLKIWA